MSDYGGNIQPMSDPYRPAPSVRRAQIPAEAQVRLCAAWTRSEGIAVRCELGAGHTLFNGKPSMHRSDTARIMWTDKECWG